MNANREFGRCIFVVYGLVTSCMRLLIFERASARSQDYDKLIVAWTRKSIVYFILFFRKIHIPGIQNINKMAYEWRIQQHCVRLCVWPGFFVSRVCYRWLVLIDSYLIVHEFFSHSCDLFIMIRRQLVVLLPQYAHT